VDSNFNLVNPDGYQVLDTSGSPIQFKAPAAPPVAGDFAKISQISSDGAITYLDALGNTYYYDKTGVIGTTTLAATNNRIAVINPPSPSGLNKIGGSLFSAGPNAGVPAAAFTLAGNTANGTSEKVFSNSLEQSNVDMAGQFVKMMLTQRAYSANSKTITTADEMTQEVLNLKR
jgi:flagellar hook protein FlgE